MGKSKPPLTATARAALLTGRARIQRQKPCYTTKNNLTAPQGPQNDARQRVPSLPAARVLRVTITSPTLRIGPHTGTRVTTRACVRPSMRTMTCTTTNRNRDIRVYACAYVPPALRMVDFFYPHPMVPLLTYVFRNRTPYSSVNYTVHVERWT